MWGLRSPLTSAFWAAVAVIVMSALSLAAWAAGNAAHWNYGAHAGPAQWSALSPDYVLCGEGGQQSPIDLAGAIPAAVTSPQLNWTPAARADVVNNGHTIQVNLAGAGDLAMGERRYRLVQFHFHHRSEHTVEGRSHPLEVHFVHAADDGELAVVGVFFEEGDFNAGLEPIWAAASAEEGPAATLAAPFDPRALLPEDARAFHYAGSLTTPPCSEIVIWTVYATPLTASAEQIQDFAYVFPNNARPIQPRNRRFVLQSGT